MYFCSSQVGIIAIAIRARIYMPFKKYRPTRERLLETRSLQFLGERIHDPNLWHINRHSISYAVLIGGICCFLPIPFQTIPCLFLCMMIRCNIPLAIVIVWISNPVTMPPMMYFAYRVGNWMMGQTNRVESIELSVKWLTAQISIVWEPILLGSLVSGFSIGIVGFIAVRLYWRWKISHDWKRRRARMTLRR